MVLRKTVNRQIRKCEGFNVKIMHDGRVIRSNAPLPDYPFTIALKGNKSVAQWKNDRFLEYYPGYEVEVLYYNDKVVPGKTLLSTVRKQYPKE